MSVTSLNFTERTWILTALIGIVGLLLVRLYRHLIIRWRVFKIPGPKGWPIMGQLFDFIQMESHEYLPKMLEYWKEYRDYKIFRICSFNRLFILPCAPEYIQTVMSDNFEIHKSDDYDSFRQWLGDGILLSAGKKWHSRRKLLTPSFHFRNLEDFIEVINDQSKILVEQLSKEVGKKPFSFFPYISRCTLDIICETAMGRSLNAQINRNSEYLKAIEKISEIFHYRGPKVWLGYDWVFNLTPAGREQKRCLKVLHGFTNKVIQERKLERNQKPELSVTTEDYSISGRKKRLAFLDLLLESSDNGRILSDEDIREEVDTFMFAGHDTTGIAISWTIYLLGLHPEIQEKLFKELDEVLGDADVSAKDLPRLKYLDQVIKESLRIYPPAPHLARHIMKDMKFGDYVAPAGSRIVIMPFCLHRNPQIFPDPEKFDPDRFQAEEVVKRHPFAYIPFSAGPRNCIGQKFALMEAKIILSHILRSYEVTSVEPRHEMKMSMEMLLRPKSGILLKIKTRDK